MNGDLPIIRWSCGVCSETEVWHETRCWPSTTPGIVVVNTALAHPGLNDELPWQITHAITGRAIPGWWGSPEAAMAGAAALNGLHDWTTPIVPPIEVQHEALAVLNSCGRSPSGYMRPVSITVVNEEWAS